MVDGWAGIAAEVLRLKPLVMFHIKNAFLVRTEHDREQAMDPGSLDFYNSEPRLQLYFLLGLVYAVVTPMLLPFIIVFFSLAYVVFRHQVLLSSSLNQSVFVCTVFSFSDWHQKNNFWQLFCNNTSFGTLNIMHCIILLLPGSLIFFFLCHKIINVYNQQYESGAQFWPDVHMRLIIASIVSQILLLGLLSTQEAEKSTFALLPLPVISIWFHYVCKGRFEPAFVKFPLQVRMKIFSQI